MNRGRSYGPGRLDKRGKVWVLDYTDEFGKRRRRDLGTSRRQADLLQAEIISKRTRVLLGLEAAPVDIALAELRDKYLADLEARATEMHVRNVRGQLDRILAFLPVDRVRDLKPAQVVEYRNAIRKNGAANRTVNVQVQALRLPLAECLQIF